MVCSEVSLFLDTHNYTPFLGLFLRISIYKKSHQHRSINLSHLDKYFKIGR